MGTGLIFNVLVYNVKRKNLSRSRLGPGRSKEYRTAYREADKMLKNAIPFKGNRNFLE